MNNAAIFNQAEMIDITSTIRPRQFHTSVYFRNNAYVISGLHTPLVEKLERDQSWDHAGGLSEKRAYAASCVFGDFIYLLGGVVGERSTPSTSILRGDGMVWTAVDVSLPFPAKGAGCFPHVDKLLLYGGQDNELVWEWNFQSDPFTQIATYKFDGRLSGFQPAVFDREISIIPTDTGNVYIFMPATRVFVPTFNLASVA